MAAMGMVSMDAWWPCPFIIIIICCCCCCCMIAAICRCCCCGGSCDMGSISMPDGMPPTVPPPPIWSMPGKPAPPKPIMSGGLIIMLDCGGSALPIIGQPRWAPAGPPPFLPCPAWFTMPRVPPPPLPTILTGIGCLATILNRESFF